MYALFKGDAQIARTFPTEQDVLKAAVAEGLISGADLPADYHIEQVEEVYEPKRDWKLPREIS